MTDLEKRNAAKIRAGVYMLNYITLTTRKESVLVGTKSEVKARLRAHGGLLSDVIVQRCEGGSWKIVLHNSVYRPVNTLLSEKELWAINAKNMNFDHLEDFFGGTLPLPVDTDKEGTASEVAEKESTVVK